MTTHTEYNGHTTGDEVVTAFADQVEGRIFVITGPTAGNIGAAIAIELAKGKPAVIVLVGRTPSKFADVTAEINKLDPGVKVISVALDLSSFVSIRAGVKEILENEEIPRVDVIINNAGIMAEPFSLTVDGIERHFAVNHVGHFLFTNLLLSKFKTSSTPTIVNVSSGGHRFFNGSFASYDRKTEPYDMWQGYAQGKAGNILFTTALAARGIRSISLTPGVIWGTQLGAHVTQAEWSELQARFVTVPDREPQTHQKTLSQGAATILVAALDQKLPNGSYLHECQLYAADPRVVDPKLAEDLWALSNKLTEESFA